jgi:hypothetical protein
LEKSVTMNISRLSALLIAATAIGGVLTPGPAYAQWWSARGPADFEECADIAEKAAREVKAAALVECNAKFAGRRKPGGGYTYFDFMQNRSFDIAAPNPTPEEQKHINDQYTAFLDRERQNAIAIAAAARQQQLQQASSQNEKIAAPKASARPQPASRETRPRVKPTTCAKGSFSCDWPRLAEGIKDLKKVLFGASSSKAKRG